MIIYKCDRCGCEMDHPQNTISLPIHIVSKKHNVNGYIDAENNPVSGRKVEYQMCNKCANIVYQAAWNALSSKD